MAADQAAQRAQALAHRLNFELPSRALIRFSKEPSVLVESLVIGQDDSGRFAVMMPGRKVDLVDLNVETSLDVTELKEWPLGQSRCPLGCRKKDCYLAERGGGSFTEDEMLAARAKLFRGELRLNGSVIRIRGKAGAFAWPMGVARPEPLVDVPETPPPR